MYSLVTQRAPTLGAIGTWSPPATPSYAGAAGPAPTTDAQLLVRLLYLRELGSWGSGETDFMQRIASGQATVAQVVNEIRAWRAANPTMDNRANFPQLVSWATSQLNGDQLAGAGGAGGFLSSIPWWAWGIAGVLAFNVFGADVRVGRRS